MVMSKRHKEVIRGLSWVLFILYIIALVYFLFFSEQMGRTPSDAYKYSLEPLKEIRRFIKYHRQLGWKTVVLNLVGNVVAFAPFGFVLPIISRYKAFFQVFFISLEFSLVVEIIQLVSKVGSFDVDDILLNTLGGILGYLLFEISYRFLFRHRGKKQAREEK